MKRKCVVDIVLSILTAKRPHSTKISSAGNDSLRGVRKCWGSVPCDFTVV